VNTQEGKVPSPELLSLIKAASQSLLGFGELWNSIKKKGHDEGFTERELQDILRPLLKPQLNKDQIYYLFNADEKKEQSKQQYHRNIPTDDDKKGTEQNNIHIIKGKELADEVREIAKVEGIDLSKADMNKTKEVLSNVNLEEDPKDTEIAFLKEKVSELEEALKKTQQFTPATQLETKPNPNIDDDIAFSYLQARANNTGDIIYFGRVGSGALVQALAQYKNSFGVVELFGRVVKK